MPAARWPSGSEAIVERASLPALPAFNAARQLTMHAVRFYSGLWAFSACGPSRRHNGTMSEGVTVKQQKSPTQLDYQPCTPHSQLTQH